MTDPSPDKKTAILSAALELFADNGFHCAPVSRLAHLAGVGVGSIYRYFKDKDELIHALYEQVSNSVQEVVNQPCGEAQPLRDQFVDFMVRLLSYLDAHPREFRFLEQYYHSPFGIEKKRTELFAGQVQDFPQPLARIFSGELAGELKSLPIPLYHALIFGPVSALLNDSQAGLITLDQATMSSLAEGCWQALQN